MSPDSALMISGQSISTSQKHNNDTDADAANVSQKCHYWWKTFRQLCFLSNMLYYFSILFISYEL